MPENPTTPENPEKLRRTLTELSEEFGMRAVVDTLVDIDNEQWDKRLAPAKRLIGHDEFFDIQFDKATDAL